MTGTVRKNRTAGIPDSVKRAVNGVGTVTALRKGSLLAVSFRQKASQKQPGVILISTSETARWVDSTGNVVPENNRDDKAKPQVVHLYNHTKMCVDLADQKMYEYEVERKTRRWTIKVAMRLIQKALLNVYILYEKRMAIRCRGGNFI
ncbi:piggyBac transposable element-derived protein 4-like [Diadema antillarum]|uniref:piggyBac transposable element-derived protein 4-like n=1 Tax=Diadema antillarum TaxID=105358 RepID=UPI003A8A6DFE